MNETVQNINEFQEKSEQPEIAIIKEQPKKQKTIDLNDYVHKKIAAREVYNNLKKIKTLSLISTIGIFIVLLSTILGLTIAAIAALIFSGINGYYMFKSQNMMKYFEQKYGIK